MSSTPAPVTNPGRSENIAKQQSLADAIAKNLTEGREAAEAAARGEKPQEQERRAPEPVQEQEQVPEREQSAEPQEQRAELEPREEGEGQDSIATDASDETPGSWTLSDFAEAADVDVETLMSRLQVEVKEGDKVRTANLADVLNGYRWNAVNTQRAQEIADARREIETQQQGMQARLAEITDMHDRAESVVRSEWELVTKAEEALRARYDAEPWAELQARADGSYADTEARYIKANNELHARKTRLQESFNRVQQERQELAQRQQAEVIPQQRAKMLELIPEWRDSERFESDKGKMVEHAVKRYGWTEQELGNITDARIVAALHRLWTLETQASKAGIAEKVVRKAPVMLPPGQRAAKGSAKKERVDKMRRKLKASGRAADLASLVRERGFDS